MRSLLFLPVLGVPVLPAPTPAHARDRAEADVGALFRAGIQAMTDGARPPERPREQKFDEALGRLPAKSTGRSM